MDVPTFAVQLLNGVQYGLVLFLVASGLTLVFGILGVINLAHGAFYMLGAYLAYWLAAYTGSFLAALAGGATECTSLPNRKSRTSSRTRMRPKLSSTWARWSRP